MNTFKTLSEIDVSGHIEKKGQFSYLSWPFAVHQLRMSSPEARWEVLRFDGLPYLATPLGYFVEVAVTVDGITLSQIHPVLNARNQPILAPTPFDINTSIQRCLVKAIALHGLGLSIYAGEDLPLHEAEKPAGSARKATGEPLPMTHTPTDGAIDSLAPDQRALCQTRYESITGAGKNEMWAMAANLFYTLDNECKVAVWEMLKPHSALRAKIKQLKDYEPGSDE